MAKSNKIISKMDRRKFIAGAGVAAGAFIVNPESIAGKPGNPDKPDQSFLQADYAKTRLSEYLQYIFNVRECGAKGDGVTKDTEAIQKAIDLCHQAGGGKVYLNNGCFISGTLYLKSNVTLHVEAGAILRASGNLDDFPVIPSKYPSYTGTFVTNKMLIYAEDKQNITISGRGTIDGNGDYWIDGPYDFPSFSVRPRIIHMRGCQNVHVRDITLYNSASWVQFYQSCTNLVVNGITVDSRENPDIEIPRFEDAPGRNNDGLNLVDCKIVRISNCYINSGDDAIVIKTFSPDEASQDITITNCVMSSNASGIRFGTETSGGFKDITIQNCVVYDTRGHAVSIMTFDGARVERINVNGIVARNIKGAIIHLHLHNRNRTYRKDAKINDPYLKDVIIENIQGETISSGYGCFIKGLPDQPVENIVLRNINITFKEGDIMAQSYRLTPYREKDPTFRDLSGYGFFMWYAKNIIIDNIRMNYGREEKLLTMLCDSVKNLDIKGLRASGTLHASELIRLYDCRDVVISENRPTASIPVFLSVHGDNSDNIILQNNLLKNAKENFVLEKRSMEKILTEYGTIK